MKKDLFRLKAQKPLEEQIVREIMQYLEYQGIRLYRIVERIPYGYKSSLTSTPGMPDLVGYVRRGRLGVVEPIPVYIEVKRPGGKHRPSQEMFINNLLNDGIIAFFADSLEVAIKELQKRGLPVKNPL